MLNFAKSVLFWISFWLFYAFALVVGTIAFLIFYVCAAPFALYELMLTVTKRMK